jgi:hypothetical protein
MAADIVTEPEFRAGEPRLLFHGDYEEGLQVTDDCRFLMVWRPAEPDSLAADRPEAGDEPLRRTILVVNWFEELRSLFQEEGGNP